MLYYLTERRRPPCQRGITTIRLFGSHTTITTYVPLKSCCDFPTLRVILCISNCRCLCVRATSAQRRRGALIDQRLLLYPLPPAPALTCPAITHICYVHHNITNVAINLTPRQNDATGKWSLWVRASTRNWSLFTRYKVWKRL